MVRQQPKAGRREAHLVGPVVPYGERKGFWQAAGWQLGRKVVWRVTTGGTVVGQRNLEGGQRAGEWKVCVEVKMTYIIQPIPNHT